MKFDIASVAALTRANGIQAYATVVKEVKDATLPILRNYQGLMEADKAVMKNAAESNRALTGSTNKPWPALVSAVLEQHLLQESEIDDLIAEIVPKSVEVESIDSRSVQLAVYIDTLSYFSNFTRMLVVMEIDVVAKAQKRELSPVLSAAERQEVVKGFDAFRVALTQISAMGKTSITKSIKETPDYVVSAADLDALNATYGSKKATPLAQNFFSADWNPIFKIRSIFNDRLIKRYHIAKEQRQNLEYTIQVLKDQAEGNNNPALQEELAYHTGRLKRLNTELKHIEDKAR